MTVQHAVPVEAPASLVRPLYLIWAALALSALAGVIMSENIASLNFIHVMFGVLWTGIDLFMGFVLGPVLRRLPAEAKRAVLVALVPRTLVLMPVLSIMTATSGWFLAKQMGFLDLTYPKFLWVAAALAIVAGLTAQGLGILLPTNLLMYFELHKPQIDDAKITRWMRRYIRVVASQGLMQVAIIVIMSRFATGL
jgi:hypothetical protein